MERRDFGSLRKLPSGRWQASYWQNGVRHVGRVTFTTKGEARGWLTGVETDLARGDWIDPSRAKVSFADWAQTWRAGIVDLRPSTFARDMGYLDRYLIPAFADKRLGDIDLAAVRRWVADMSASGLAPATVVKGAQILSKIMRSAVEEGILRANPCVNVKLPRIERTEMRFLSPSEVDRLAEAIDARYRAAVILGAYGGLRAGELFGLRISRLNLETQSLDVSRL